MTERLNHKLDTSKIKTLEDVKNIFECMNLYASASEDAKDYELIKEYFTIPNPPQELKFELPRKSLEEIKLMIGEKDPVKQILNDPNDELNHLIARIPTEGAIAMAEPIRKALEELPND